MDAVKDPQNLSRLHEDEILEAVYRTAIQRKNEKPIVSVRKLRKVFRMGQEKVVALDQVSVDFYKGEIICLIGSSGSGKSTFLNMLAGLEKPTRGTIQFGKVFIQDLDEKDITLFRQKNIGFIFQAYHLLPTMTALENVALPLTFKGISLKERNQKAEYYLKHVGLGKLLYRKPTEMSGGQQQRVGIARALTAEPKVIFADEPTGNLDSRSTKEVLNLILRCVRETKQTLILVTHDPSIAQYADVVVTLKDGNIIEFKEQVGYQLPSIGKELKEEGKNDALLEHVD